MCYTSIVKYRNEVILIFTTIKWSVQSVLAMSRNSIIYKVSDGENIYILKTSRFPSEEEQEAYEDEYSVIRSIQHPSLPAYYAFYKNIQPLDTSLPVPAVLMEYIDGIPLSSIEYLTTSELKKYILDLGEALITLLENGVLYMDLHPDNILIADGQIRIIDFTKAYYYIKNPNPSYMPKISYQINQHLPGQQILIQALTHFFLHLPKHLPVHTYPSHLIELGTHPYSALSFWEFLNKIEKEWETD